MRGRASSVMACGALIAASALGGQTPAPDTLSLRDLYAATSRGDPRTRERELLAAQSSLRDANLSAERLPTLGVEGMAQYQSDVARIPLALPGLAVPTPSHDTYDARVVANQRLLDPTLGARRALERAQLAEAQARTDVTLYTLRQQVNDAFFAALRAGAQISELTLTITDLEAQRDVAARRVREGAALPSEEEALRAEILRRRQALAEWRSNRGAALVVLSDLSGVRVDTAAVLAEPDLRGAVAAVRAALQPDSGMRRPELEQFARARDVLVTQRRLRSAQDLPRLSAFGRAGYGRPGLNPLSNRFDSYWLAGVQLQWSPWTWGATGRDREVLALQSRIVAAEEEAFRRQLTRTTAQDLAAIDRLEAELSTDDEIIALRERVLAEARARYAEAVITSAEYVDRQTDVLAARVARAIHRVELAQARARFLTTLGVEVR